MKLKKPGMKFTYLALQLALETTTLQNVTP